MEASMKSMVACTVVVAAAFLAQLTPAAAQQQLEQPSQVGIAAEGELRQLAQRYSDLYNARDADALAQLFAHDAWMTNPRGETLNGRDEIARALADELAGPGKDARHEVLVEEVRTLAPEVAISRGTFRIAGLRVENGPEQTIEGTYLATFTRIGNEWRIVALQGAVPADTQPQPTTGRSR
jgi:uncharacterized protein (TIGR02246 family)